MNKFSKLFRVFEAFSGPRRRLSTASILSDVILTVVSLLLIGYSAVFAWNSVAGVSLSVDTAERIVVIDIINCTGEIGIAAEISRKIDGFQDIEVQIEVAEAVDYDLKKIRQSLIVARESNLETARLVAERLGLDNSRVIFKELKQNHRHVAVSVLLGQDWNESLALDNIRKGNLTATF